MSNPFSNSVVPGTYHTVVEEDWLSKLAVSAYGDISKWPEIEAANPQINGRDTAVDGSPLIFPDEDLYIPILQVDEDAIPSFGKQQEDGFSLTIEGKLVAVVESSLTKGVDIGARTFDALVDLNQISKEVRGYLLPFKYPKCTVHIDGVLQLTGRVFIVSPSSAMDKSQKKIVGYSNSKNFVDSVVTAPYEQRSVTLKQRTIELCRGLSLSPVFRAGADERFDKATANQNEKRFDHIKKLAQERGLLVSDTPRGNPLVIAPDESKSIVDTIIEGEADTTNFGATYDGTKMHSSVTVTGKSITGTVTSTVQNKIVPIARFFSKKKRRVDKGSIESSAQTARSREMSKALSTSFTRDGYQKRSGGVWDFNEYVGVKSETLDINVLVSLLIRRVKFINKLNKTTTIIDVVPLEVFTKDELEYIWSLA